jgi:hypothetical protein
VQSLARSGFVHVGRRVFGSLVSEYTGERPSADGASADRHLVGSDAAEPVAAQDG